MKISHLGNEIFEDLVFWWMTVLIGEYLLNYGGTRNNGKQLIFGMFWYAVNTTGKFLIYHHAYKWCTEWLKNNSAHSKMYYCTVTIMKNGALWWQKCVKLLSAQVCKKLRVALLFSAHLTCMWYLVTE